MRGFTRVRLLFSLLSFSALAKHGELVDEAKAKQEYFQLGAKALADRAAGMLLCTFKNAPGGKSASTLEWYFATTLSVWNDEILSKSHPLEASRFEVETFQKSLSTALASRLQKEKLPDDITSQVKGIAQAVGKFTHQINENSSPIGSHSTKSLSKLEKEEVKNLRDNLAAIHAYSQTSDINCDKTEKRSGFWAQFSFIPTIKDIGTQKDKVEDEADKALVTAMAKEKVDEPKKTEVAEADKRIEKDLENAFHGDPSGNRADRKLGKDQQVRATVYFVPDEKNYGSSKNCNVRTPSGNRIAKVNCNFLSELTTQGTGILSDGRTVNYVKNGRFEVTPYKYGVGSNSKPLVPFRSLAIDLSYWRNRGIPAKDGDQIYIASTDGMKIPGTDEVHDGMWVISDKGGRIKGNKVDLFFGTMHWREVLKYVNDPSNFQKTESATAQAADIGNRLKTVDMNFVL